LFGSTPGYQAYGSELQRWQEVIASLTNVSHLLTHSSRL
jgi:hypothetical protein